MWTHVRITLALSIIYKYVYKPHHIPDNVLNKKIVVNIYMTKNFYKHVYGWWCHLLGLLASPSSWLADVFLHHCGLGQSCISCPHEIILTSTAAMLAVLHLCVYNKKNILKTDYLPYSITKKLQLFWKIDSECNLLFYIQLLQRRLR